MPRPILQMFLDWLQDRGIQGICLFQRHKECFQSSEVPLLYHPRDSRKQNIMVTIPGTNQKQQLVLNDIKSVTIEAAEVAIRTGDWRLGYALTVHSSQGLTIKDPQSGS